MRAGLKKLRQLLPHNCCLKYKIQIQIQIQIRTWCSGRAEKTFGATAALLPLNCVHCIAFIYSAEESANYKIILCFVIQISVVTTQMTERQGRAIYYFSVWRPHCGALKDENWIAAQCSTHCAVCNAWLAICKGLRGALALALDTQSCSADCQVPFCTALLLLLSMCHIYIVDMCQVLHTYNFTPKEHKFRHSDKTL